MSANIFDNGSISHDAVESIMTANGTVLAKSRNIGRVKAKGSATQSVMSQGSTSGIFANNNTATLSYLLPLGTSNQLDIVRNMVFEFTVTNTDGTGNALLMLPCQFWANIIQLSCAGSIFENLYPENFLIESTFLQENDEKILAKQTLENYVYNAATTGFNSSFVSIADGASKTFYFSLNCSLNKAELFLSAINTQITIEIQFNPAPYLSTSLSTSVSMSSAKLIMSGIKFDEVVRNKLLQRYASNATSSLYLLPQREIIPGISLSSATTSYIQVTSFSGQNLAALFVASRKNGAAKEELYTYDLLAEIDLKNSGSSVFLNSLKLREYTIMNLNNLPSSASFCENMVMMPFSVDPYNTLKIGRESGWLTFSPNFSLEILSTVTATKELVLIGFQYNKLTIKGGQLYREAI